MAHYHDPDALQLEYLDKFLLRQGSGDEGKFRQHNFLLLLKLEELQDYQSHKQPPLSLEPVQDY